MLHARTDPALLEIIVQLDDVALTRVNMYAATSPPKIPPSVATYLTSWVGDRTRLIAHLFICCTHRDGRTPIHALFQTGLLHSVETLSEGHRFDLDQLKSIIKAVIRVDPTALTHRDKYVVPLSTTTNNGPGCVTHYCTSTIVLAIHPSHFFLV